MSEVLMLTIRKFNQKGNDRYATIVRQKSESILEEIDAILEDETLTEIVKPFGKTIQLVLQPIVRRFELAQNLYSYFGAPQAPLRSMVGDVYLWNWISAAWMKTLLEATGKAELLEQLGKQEERWVLTSNTLRYHRHLVSSPFFAYDSNSSDPNRAMCLLATDVLMPGEVVERISGKRSLSIGSVCHLATLLYFDKATGSLRKGVTSGLGTPKAFSYYFSQIDLTTDFEGMTVDELLAILPSNFSRWKVLAKVDLLASLRSDEKEN
jgi:hypothetical protein